MIINKFEPRVSVLALYCSPLLLPAHGQGAAVGGAVVAGQVVLFPAI